VTAGCFDWRKSSESLSEWTTSEASHDCFWRRGEEGSGSREEPMLTAVRHR